MHPIDTDATTPDATAATIDAWVRGAPIPTTAAEGTDMTARFDVVVPALALRTASGSIDLAATRPYAEGAAATWVDYFILSGSTAQGQHLLPIERAAVLDLWLDVTTPDPDLRK